MNLNMQSAHQKAAQIDRFFFEGQSMDPLMASAKEFRTLFDLPQGLTTDSLRLQLSLISEEAKEVKEAVDDLDERVGHQSDHRARKAHLLKELADLVYVCYQMAAAFGWDLTEAYSRVHASNLTKLDSNGKPILREDGKILKGPNYLEPSLEDLV
jgi:NTP pyrophosphatase (non-canonical NTP hydrolase)